MCMWQIFVSFNFIFSIFTFLYFHIKVTLWKQLTTCAVIDKTICVNDKDDEHHLSAQFDIWCNKMQRHQLVSAGYNSPLPIPPKCNYAWVRICSLVRTFYCQVCFYGSQTLRGNKRTPVSGHVLYPSFTNEALYQSKETELRSPV